MGKADVRDPALVAARWPGVSYRAFDLAEAGPGRIGQILAAVLGLFGRGILTGLPVRTWSLDQAGDALRHLGQGHGTGKNVARIPAPLDRTGTVLITGASGVLAGLTARHLAATGRAGRLLLASRRGPAAPGAARLAADLAEAGAQVQVAVCDAGDRVALAGLMGQVPAAYPLAGVIHTAGVLDDGVIGTLTPDRVDRVLAPKADAALWLDELTAGCELSAFVLFSSAAATLGSPGQGNYAAANAVLDALAQDRHARGLPAVSIAWGMWDQATGLTAHLGQEGRSRSRGGILPLPTAQGLDLLDAALAAGTPAAVAINTDLAALRAQARAGTLPPLWQGLIRSPATHTAPASVSGTFRDQLTSLPPDDQDRQILDLIRAQAAAVLGHPASDPVRPAAAFRDLGFDSLTAIELRNRLSTITGLRMPATLVFDHPTPQALATWLRTAITQDQNAPAPAAPIFTELDSLEVMLSTASPDDLTRVKVTTRLQVLLSKWNDHQEQAAESEEVSDLESASDDEIISFINKELGR
jgi:NADP-dependent 3-hydroxy acid dehydrogenase YdfG/acyl carrier protein